MKKKTNSAQNANKSAKRKPAKSKSAGNIWNMQCPKCGSDEAVVVQVLVWAHVDVDHVEPGGESMWTDSSPCHCGVCQHFGEVRKFRIDANPNAVFDSYFTCCPIAPGDD
jgi:hypothetical protein